MTETLTQPAELGAPSQPKGDIVSLIQQATETGSDPAYLRELLAVRREWKADEARADYHAAIADFQRLAPIVEKGDDAHGKDYARLDRIWRSIRPTLSECGLSVTWTVFTLSEGVAHVEGQLAHRSGHSVPLVRDIPLPDLVRGQNLAQQAGSAESYAKRYALCSALGIVTGDDDDGHNIAPVETITAEMADALREALASLDDAKREVAGMKYLTGRFGVESLDDIPASGFDWCQRAIEKVRSAK